MKHILITGANGQLGQSILRLSAPLTQYDWHWTDVDTLNICDADAVQQFVQDHHIDCIINCAAYTAVDKAEDNQALCAQINCDAVRNLGEAAAAVGARMIHVSTDYVFDGSACHPYKEDDQPCPASVYGQTKRAGEEALFNACPNAVVLRTAWLYSEYGNNFVKTMLRLGNERDQISVVFDQVGTPTYAGDLAKAILAIVQSADEGHYVPGIYHFSNEGVCSWYDFATKIMQIGKRNCQVMPIESADYPARAPRPSFSVLNKAKIKTTYQLAIPHWEESLILCMHNLLQAE